MRVRRLLALDCASQEAAGAQTKFPSTKHMHAALVEEVGELANALIEHDRGKLTAGDVFDEAIQVAAMAIRIATEGDESFTYAYDDSFAHTFVPTGSKPTEPPTPVVDATGAIAATNGLGQSVQAERRPPEGGGM